MVSAIAWSDGAMSPRHCRLCFRALLVTPLVTGDPERDTPEVAGSFVMIPAERDYSALEDD
jgi:hypothetical protein